MPDSIDLSSLGCHSFNVTVSYGMIILPGYYGCNALFSLLPSMCGMSSSGNNEYSRGISDSDLTSSFTISVPNSYVSMSPCVTGGTGYSIWEPDSQHSVIQGINIVISDEGKLVSGTVSFLLSEDLLANISPSDVGYDNSLTNLPTGYCVDTSDPLGVYVQNSIFYTHSSPSSLTENLTGKTQYIGYSILSYLTGSALTGTGTVGYCGSDLESRIDISTSDSGYIGICMTQDAVNASHGAAHGVQIGNCGCPDIVLSEYGRLFAAGIYLVAKIEISDFECSLTLAS